MAVSPRIRRARILQAAEGYLELDLPRRALAELERIEEPASRKARWYTLAAEAWQQLDDTERALAAWSRVLMEDPLDLDVLLGLAWCYRRSGQISREISALQDACRAWPEEGRALFRLACALAVAGEQEQALSWLGRAVRLDRELRNRIHDEPDLASLRTVPGFEVIAGVEQTGDTSE